MLKVAAAVCVMLILCSCVSTGHNAGEPKAPSEEVSLTDLNYWITTPKSGGLVIMGVSGFKIKRESEITAAREDAAKKVSMYYGVQAEVSNVQSIGSNAIMYFADTDISVSYDSQTDQYLDQLTFDPKNDVFTRKNAVFVRFTYPAASPGAISYTSEKNANGSPKWTTSPPHEIGGFMVGVGFARRQERMQNTFIKSAESAVAALVSRISSSVDTGEVSTATQGTSYIRHHSSGKLSQFTVLEIWIDPKNDAVWTLAIARGGN